MPDADDVAVLVGRLTVCQRDALGVIVRDSEHVRMGDRVMVPVALKVVAEGVPVGLREITDPVGVGDSLYVPVVLLVCVPDTVPDLVDVTLGVPVLLRLHDDEQLWVLVPVVEVLPDAVVLDVAVRVQGGEGETDFVRDIDQEADGVALDVAEVRE